MQLNCMNRPSSSSVVAVPMPMPACHHEHSPPAPLPSVEAALMRMRSVDAYSSALDALEQGNVAPPRIVHQSWKTCTPGARQVSWRNHCQRLNARTRGWDFWLWTDAANRDLIRREFPHFLGLYDEYDMKVKQIDAVRYFYLFLYGGWYIDLDMLCLKSFETIALPPGHASVGFKNRAKSDQNCSCDALRARPRRGPCGSCIMRLSEIVPNAFMAAPPRHPFIAFLIHRLNASKRLPFKSHKSHPSVSTGPRFLTTATADWHGLKLGGLHALNFPVIFNSRFVLGRRHWCGWAATFPDKLAPEKARAEFERCAAKRPDIVTTSFWTSSWLPRANDSHGRGKLLLGKQGKSNMSEW